MGESDRYIDYSSQRAAFGDDKNSLVALVILNAVIFVGLLFVKVLGLLMREPVGFFEADIAPWFLLPSSLADLATRPWTFFTYMFTHTDLFMTFSNMIWLWVFGSIFQNMKGNRRLIPVYMYGGFAGAIAFITVINLFPTFLPESGQAAMQGANAATMAVAFASTALAPNLRFLKMLNGGIPLWILTMIYVAIDFAGLGSGHGAYNIAHLTAGLTGFLFIFFLRKGWDWSTWMLNLYDWFINLFNPAKKEKPVNRIREKVFYRTGSQKPFVKTSNVTQQRVDEILDKINVKGYQFLTEEEKNILNRAGEDL